MRCSNIRTVHLEDFNCNSKLTFASAHFSGARSWSFFIKSGQVALLPVRLRWLCAKGAREPLQRQAKLPADRPNGRRAGLFRRVGLETKLNPTG